ncbi:MAG TPA: YkgJ family cysteine cluster protein [Dissulfurispiraceae bacterium]
MKIRKPPARLHFPDAEQKLPWLAMLLEAYAVIDKGVAFAAGKHEKKHRTKLACAKGCSNCCRTHKDIPLYPLEMVGLYWFAIEKLERPARDILKNRLLAHCKDDPCPFLIEGSCSVHPLRPVACRQFNVFGAACAEGEDPYYTRRGDVLTPDRDYTGRAFSIMLPFYGISDATAKKRAIKGGLIHTQARELHACNWKELARRMDDFDFGRR